MPKPTIEEARQVLNEWEHHAANDLNNQRYIQAWADNSEWTFVEVYTYLVNEEKAGFLKAWGFSDAEAWEVAATHTKPHILIGGEGRPIAMEEFAPFAFAPNQ